MSQTMLWLLNLCTDNLSRDSSLGVWDMLVALLVICGCDFAAETYDESYISMAPSSATRAKSYWTGEYRHG